LTGQSDQYPGTSVNTGVSRIEELLHYSKDIKTPQMTIYFNNDICSDKTVVNKISSYFKYLTINDNIIDHETITIING
jgi:hypothetical protein